MTDTSQIDRPLHEDPPAPNASECVLCFVARMLQGHGCDTTLRWVRRWRDARLPRATGLERRFEARGGYCDCEVIMNGWTLQAAADDLDEDDGDDGPWPLPPCPGVSPRSSQPCDLWEPLRRGRW
jgi:hypothetical protein